MCVASCEEALSCWSPPRHHRGNLSLSPPTLSSSPSPSVPSVFPPQCAHLRAQLFPLAVELLQLLLQQGRVAGGHVLSQVGLHGGQLPQSAGQTLQSELRLLHNRRRVDRPVRRPCTSCALTFLSLCGPGTLQIKGLWTGQGEGRRGVERGEGRETVRALNKGKGGNSWGHSVGTAGRS